MGLAGYDLTMSVLRRCPSTDHPGCATHCTQLYAVKPEPIVISAGKELQMMDTDIHITFPY